MRSTAVCLLAALSCAVPAAAQLFSGAPDLAGALDDIREASRMLGKEIREQSQIRSPRPGSPDISAYPAHGIDVSRWQGEIDWGKVKAAGVSFAYIEATRGLAPLHPSFGQNWSAAKAAGIPRGAYHFYDFCGSAVRQAKRFIAAVPVDRDALAPVIDLEQDSCEEMPGKPEFMARFASFLSIVQGKYGRSAILYMSYGIYDAYFSGDSLANKIWIADPFGIAPQLSDNRSWTLWQYSWKGRVDGISGPVDLDVYHGPPERMLAELRSAQTTPTRPDHASVASLR